MLGDKKQISFPAAQTGIRPAVVAACIAVLILHCLVGCPARPPKPKQAPPDQRAAIPPAPSPPKLYDLLVYRDGGVESAMKKLQSKPLEIVVNATSPLAADASTGIGKDFDSINVVSVVTPVLANPKSTVTLADYNSYATQVERSLMDSGCKVVDRVRYDDRTGELRLAKEEGNLTRAKALVYADSLEETRSVILLSEDIPVDSGSGLVPLVTWVPKRELAALDYSEPGEELVFSLPLGDVGGRAVPGMPPLATTGTNKKQSYPAEVRLFGTGIGRAGESVGYRTGEHSIAYRLFPYPGLESPVLAVGTRNWSGPKSTGDSSRLSLGYTCESTGSLYVFGESGPALRIRIEDLNLLQANASDQRRVSAGFFALPVTDAGGNQQYGPSMDSGRTKRVSVELPITTIQMVCKVTHVDTSEIVWSATAQMSFRDVLKEPFRFPVSENGNVDTSSWPGVDRQKAEILRVLFDHAAREFIRNIKESSAGRDSK